MSHYNKEKVDETEHFSLVRSLVSWGLQATKLSHLSKNPETLERMTNFILLVKYAPLYIGLSKVALGVNFRMQGVIQRGKDGRNGPLRIALLVRQAH